MSQAKRGRDLVQKFSWALCLLEVWYKIFPKKIRKKIFERKRYAKGLWGMARRYALLKSLAKKCGQNVSIHEGVYLFNVENLSVGDNVSVHPMCYIEAQGGVIIGNDVSIAHGVTILSTTHSFSDVEVPIRDQPIEILPTEIGNNIWIGAKATIIGGVHIEDGCVIGATTVVKHNVEKNSIVVGVPGRKIKSR